MTTRIQTLIDALHLKPHPEGGFYGEVFRSTLDVSPADGRPVRQALTAIHFLLSAGQVSRWHRVLSDEAWSHLEGDPLELHSFDAGQGRLTTVRLGRFSADEQPLHVVPAGHWQAARPLGDYTLVGCFVGPGFDFSDFSLAADDPQLADVIRALGESAARLI